jgi:hypothetical protein
MVRLMQTYPIPPISTLSYALLFNALFSFIAVIYLQVSYSRSSKYDPNYSSPYAIYDIGVFDFESWACQLSKLTDDFPRTKCYQARAGNAVDTIWFFVALAAAISGILALRGERDSILQARREKRSRNEYWLGQDGEGNPV